MKKVLKLMIVLLLFSMALVGSVGEREQGKGPIAPYKRPVPGKRFSLSRGQLYVPSYFSSENSGLTELVLFFHGASWCAEQNFFDAAKNAVMVSVTVKNYGYPEIFKDPDKLEDILAEVFQILEKNNISSKPIKKICLASFSGGYSAIREILGQDQYRSLITDVVLADSLYGPITEGGNHLESAALEPFLRYARRAAGGEVGFWFSHLYPPKEEHRGNKTTLAANDLIKGVGAEKKPCSGKNSRGARLLYRADLGNFHVLGYEGMTTQDHFEHFYALSDLLAETSLSPVVNKGKLPGFENRGRFHEQIKSYVFDPKVKIHINAPGREKFDPGLPTRVILYALPNGNTTAQTIGKKVTEGVDWHYGIQHIGAQTRRLREVIKKENIVTVYLEAEGRSWPSWRRKQSDSSQILQSVIESILSHVPVPQRTVHLSSHSGGGSLIFTYLNGLERLPHFIKRICFLDSIYNYSDEEKHGDKLLAWMKKDENNHLVILCYDDRNIRLNGKRVVGPTGGTYRKTQKMLERFFQDLEFRKSVEGAVVRYRGLDNQIDVLIHENPENKILHTVMVGDMNGFIHAETTGTPYENEVAVYGGPLAYEKWIDNE